MTKFLSNRCPDGHSLETKLTTGGIFGQNSKHCGVCGVKIAKGVNRHSCKSCNYHLCDSCFGPAGGGGYAGGSGSLPSVTKDDSHPALARASTNALSTTSFLEEQQKSKCRPVCKYALDCYRKDENHLKTFSHPGDSDYVVSVRKAGVKAKFLTLKQCFEFCDPMDKGIIDDKAILGDLLKHLDRNLNEEELDAVWGVIDDDGNGYCSFAEFVEWAQGFGIDLPLGLEQANSPSGKNVKLECGFQGCKCKNFVQVGEANSLGIVFCKCGHKRELHAATAHDAMVQCPPYWSNTDFDIEEFNEWAPCDEETVSHMQLLIDSSVKRTWTRDRGKGVKVPSGYVVESVFRNENSKVWRKYALKKAMMKSALDNSGDPLVQFTTKTSLDWTGLAQMDEPPVEAGINEWYLWHGTSPAGAEAICKIDFQQRLAGTATGTLYGAGTYFAESCTKADEYAKEATDGDHEGKFCLLLTRVIGGRVLYNDEVEPDADDLTSQVLHGNFDCVIGDREKCRNTFKEFVVFGSDQAYPEYIVYYSRLYD